MNHKLVGKVVQVYHRTDTSVPYQPLQVADVDGAFIKFAPVLEGSNRSVCDFPGREDLLYSFWMPIADCKQIMEIIRLDCSYCGFAGERVSTCPKCGAPE